MLYLYTIIFLRAMCTSLWRLTLCTEETTVLVCPSGSALSHTYSAVEDIDDAFDTKVLVGCNQHRVTILNPRVTAIIFKNKLGRIYSETISVIPQSAKLHFNLLNDYVDAIIVTSL